MANFELKEQHKEIIIKVMAGALFFIMGYLMTVKPAFESMNGLRANLQTAKQRLTLHREINDLKTQLAVQEKLFSNEEDRSLILGQISSKANEAKISIQSLVPKTETIGNYQKLRIEIDGKGAFFSIVKFLKLLETLQPVLTIKDMTMIQSRLGDPKIKIPQLQLHVVLETYLKGKSGKKL